MMVILRIGPFDHGEMRNGGLPDWLYGKPFEVRNSNEGYLRCARRLYAAIHSQVDGHYFHQGGPVVGIQIENEYMHSSAPWEITTGVANEWVNGGRDGNGHMLDLKRIAVEEGLIAPFYTCTAWGGAMAPTEEMLPLWGGYAYWPWIFYSRTGEHPLTPEYIYRDNHNGDVRSTYNFEPRYDPESRPYACCEMMGGMMCSYNYRFTLPFESVDALANIKLGSGCTMLGYYMYRGGTNPTGEKTPFLNEGQVSKRSYDYQAPVGEFGQLRPSWYRLRTLHDFCKSFSDELIGSRTVLPDWGDQMEPGDTGRLRFSVRIKEEAGFVFLNNFQDHMDLPPRHNEAITLHLKEETITLSPISLASGENAILPFNLAMGGVRLRFATAQPITRLNLAGTNCWFFTVPEGMAPSFHFARESILSVSGCRAEQTDSEWICWPDADTDFAMETAEGMIRVMVMSRAQSMRFSHIVKDGQDVAILADGAFLWDGKKASLEMTGGPADIMTYPEDLLDKEQLTASRPDAKVAPVRQGIFSGYRITLPKPVLPEAALHTEKVGDSRWTMNIPIQALYGHKEVLLRVRYIGNIGQAFIDGEMISDNFCNGQLWDIRLDCYVDRLKDHPLTLYIVPIKEGASVSVDSAMAARMEQVEGLTASLDGVDLQFVDDVRVTL
jgi:hypothetical protein